MSKLGDDLIQSLKEAVAHAKGDGPGTEHAPTSPRRNEAGDVQQMLIVPPTERVDSQSAPLGPGRHSEMLAAQM